MPMSTVKTLSAQVSVANAARDGTGALATIVTAATNGTKVTAVKITATQATTAGVIRLFLSDGITSRLIDEVLVPAITPSVSVTVFSTFWLPPSSGGGATFGVAAALDIPPGSFLKASTEKAETFNLLATAVDN